VVVAIGALHGAHLAGIDTEHQPAVVAHVEMPVVAAGCPGGRVPVAEELPSATRGGAEPEFGRELGSHRCSGTRGDAPRGGAVHDGAAGCGTRNALEVCADAAAGL